MLPPFLISIYTLCGVYMTCYPAMGNKLFCHPLICMEWQSNTVHQLQCDTSHEHGRPVQA